MSVLSSCSVAELVTLVGTPECPVIIDGRIEDDFALDPRMVPGSIRRPLLKTSEWLDEMHGESVIILCHKGQKLSQGAAALLRSAGISARYLTGGVVAWSAQNLPMVPENVIPARNALGQSMWVTRERPKIDRIACPWLIRRFIDRSAQFLFVETEQVLAVADRFGATPFDIEGVFWSHRGETCTFDTMLSEFGLGTPALLSLAKIVRGADTARMDLAPQAAGLLAMSLGLSRLYCDDLQQLDAGMLMYDALYRWCLDGQHETHNWPATPVSA